MRPNILLIVSDQHRRDCVGASHDYPVKTPNLDRLAADGAWFDSAYTPIPLCTPARQSLLSGQRPEATGGLWNYDLGPQIPALPPSSYSWPRELQKAGYRSQYIGKWHVNPDCDPTSFGYDSWTPLEAYDQWRAERHPEAPLGTHWFGGIDPVPTADSRTHWQADHAIEFIRQASLAEGQPWHLRVDFWEPHLPCVPTEEFASLYPTDAVPEWRDLNDRLENKPYIQRQQLVNWGVEDFSWQDWAPVAARYYAIISQMDDAIGRVLEAVRDSGASSDTLVIYTSDHGDMCGSHGMMDKHYIMYDSVVRVPMMMAWPGTISGGTRVDGFAYNTIDLAPTISTVTGIAPPPVAHGQTLFEWTGESLTPSPLLDEREQVVSTYNGQQFGLFIQRMIRTRDWKYVWNPTDVDELYDLNQDPEEFVNRIDDPGCDALLADLRNRLYEQLLKEGDRFVANRWMAKQLQQGRKLSTRASTMADNVPSPAST